MLKKIVLQVFKLFTIIYIYIIYIQLVHHVGVTKMLGLGVWFWTTLTTQYNQNLIRINFIEFITVKTRLYLRVALSRYVLFRRLSTEWHSHVTIYSD